jgi:hypothetical protein
MNREGMLLKAIFQESIPSRTSPFIHSYHEKVCSLFYEDNCDDVEKGIFNFKEVAAPV